ncbi:MAG: hypothetical protein U0228_18690 [Myxococcaceae bacterium]
MTTRSLLLASCLGSVLLVASPARAIHLGVDVGAGTWLLEAPQIDAHFRVDQELFSWLRIGVRPGVALTFNQPNSRLAVPLDASVKVKLFILYVEAFGGIYWIPSSVDPVRAHWGGGVGFRIWKFELGLEVAYLQPSVSLLGRVGFTFYGPGPAPAESKEKEN